MTGDETILHDAIACKRGVRLADGHAISVTTMGDVRMKSRDTGRTGVFRIVLLVPSLTKTLISISRITDSADAASIIFKKDYCNIRSRTHLSIVGKWNAASLYAVHGDVIEPRPAADQANAAEVAEPMLWHARCGHVPWNSMSAMIKATKGGPTNLMLPDSLSCEGCIRGKKTHTSLPKEGDRPRHKLGTGRVWVIEKALYGMKQSALMWYVHFKGILEDDGSAAMRGDGCVLTRRTNGALQTDEEVDAIFNHMQAHIRLNDMGSVAKLLGMEIYRNEDEMTMDVLQVTYIERMAAKYGLASAKAVDTPIPPGTNLSEDVGTVLNDDKPYRQIVGSLLYCAMATRPFIVHAVTQLSRHLTQPHQLHMHMERRVVAYLLHTKTDNLSGPLSGSSSMSGIAIELRRAAMFPENSVSLSDWLSG
ncbi:hypothetical protein B5M09_012911 [Aphanomyces astaci]|uniref:Uncharacterized protein n=1 Tax=Aphanomyces astaci TaxID=112090 RepID=A0A3R7WY02_APHAT|nr:hypothetical protein B5M09_012911 [Aphanomyces astaci]